MKKLRDEAEVLRTLDPSLADRPSGQRLTQDGQARRRRRVRAALRTLRRQLAFLDATGALG